MLVLKSWSTVLYLPIVPFVSQWPHTFHSRFRVSDRYSDTTNNRKLTHREISHTDNRLYHRNKGWVYRIWQLKNGARATVPASASCDLVWQSETFDNQLRIMYFRTSFPVPSLKQLLARFLHHWEATRPCCWMPDIVAIAVLSAEGCRWYVEWVAPSMNGQQIS